MESTSLVDSTNDNTKKELFGKMFENAIRKMITAGLADGHSELDAIITLAAAEKVDVFKPDSDGNTVAHRLCAGTSAEEYHHFVQLMVLLGRGDIFSVPNTILGDNAIHQAFQEKISLLPETIDLLAEKCQFNFNAVNSRDNTVFFMAARVGSRKTLERIVFYGGNCLFGGNMHGSTVLHNASLGNLEALKYILSLEGANVNATNNDSLTPLHYLVASTPHNFNEKFNTLVKAGANINAVEKNGNNLMLLAIYFCEMSNAELQHIMNRGVDWKAKCNLGYGVLHRAAEVGNVEAIHFFLSLGADVNAVAGNSDQTPLHRVIFAKKNFLESLTCLKENGADVNAKTKDGNNFVHLAITAGRSKAELEYIVNVLECDWKARNRVGHTVLHSAAHSGNYQALAYFLSLKADANIKDYYQATPLFYLPYAKQFFIQMLNELVKEGADINATDVNGRTLLSTAAIAGRTWEEIDAIVKLGCKLETTNRTLCSAMHCAALVGNVQALKCLISKGANVNVKDDGGHTPLLLSIRAENGNYREVVEVLVNHGADLNAVNFEGENLLLMAAGLGKSKNELEQIVNMGVNWRATNIHGGSILHILSKVGNLDAIQYFVSLGADVNATDHFDETPLHHVVLNKQNFIETTNMLVKNGAEINAVDANVENVIMKAMQQGRTVEELKHLVDLGANWMARSEGEEGLICNVLQHNVGAPKSWNDSKKFLD